MQAADGGGGEVFGATAAPAVFRQYCCPSCWTALYSAVVPAGHPDTVTTLGRLTAIPAR